MSIQPSNGNNGWGDALLNLPAWIVPSVELSPALEGVSVSVETGKKGVNPAAGSPTATLLRLRSSCKMEFGSCAGGGQLAHCPRLGAPLERDLSPPWKLLAIHPTPGA